MNRACLYLGLMLLAAILSGCGDKTMTGAEILDFKDHPEHFKGRTLTLIDKYEGLPLDPAAVERDGGFVAFPAVGEVNGDRHSVVFVIQIPKGMKVPGLAMFDKAIVTFVCNEGNAMKGNVAVEIRRP